MLKIKDLKEFIDGECEGCEHYSEEKVYHSIPAKDALMTTCDLPLSEPCPKSLTISDLATIGLGVLCQVCPGLIKGLAYRITGDERYICRECDREEMIKPEETIDASEIKLVEQPLKKEKPSEDDKDP